MITDWKMSHQLSSSNDSGDEIVSHHSSERRRVSAEYRDRRREESPRTRPTSIHASQRVPSIMKVPTAKTSSEVRMPSLIPSIQVPVLPSLPKEDKLDGSNFSIWSCKVECILDTFDLWDFVSSPIERPIVDTTDGTSMDRAALWDRLNSRARSFLFMSLSDSVLVHVHRLKTAADVWQKLLSLYQHKTFAHKISLEKKLRMLSLDDSSSMKEHITKMDDMRGELASLGRVISSEDMAMILLTQLPSPRFDVFYTSLITSRSRDSLLWEELSPLVLEHDERLKEVGASTSGSNKAFTAGASGGKKKKQQKEKAKEKKDEDKDKKETKEKKPKCPHCGKGTHPEEKCWQKYPHLKPKEKETTAAPATTESAFVHVFVEENTALASTTQEKPWLVDSGASSHMTFRKDWLQDLSSRGGTVTIGDNSTVPVQGVGTLPMFSDGRSSSEVLYVPELGFNLLSVYGLTQLGTRVIFTQDAVIVEDASSGDALWTGSQEGGLYKLTALTAKVSHELSLLWHARYGHLNLDAIRRASRRKIVEGLPDFPPIHTLCPSCLRGNSINNLIHRLLLEGLLHRLSWFILTYADPWARALLERPNI